MVASIYSAWRLVSTFEVAKSSPAAKHKVLNTDHAVFLSMLLSYSMLLGTPCCNVHRRIVLQCNGRTDGVFNQGPLVYIFALPPQVNYRWFGDLSHDFYFFLNLSLILSNPW